MPKESVKNPSVSKIPARKNLNNSLFIKKLGTWIIFFLPGFIPKPIKNLTKFIFVRWRI
jgi:hypothetical protein